MHLQRSTFFVAEICGYRQPMPAHPDRLPTPPGFSPIGLFLFFGALMAALAATTLLWPGTILDRLWSLNPSAHARLAPHRRVVGILFLPLSAALACSGVGWFRRRPWGWKLTVAILTIQALGDTTSLITGDYLRGAAGLIIAGALLFYLLRTRVRSAFLPKTASATD